MHKIYYAHPMSYYNTSTEQQTLNYLSQITNTIINPNTTKKPQDWQNKTSTQKMMWFEHIVKTCDHIYAQPYSDGMFSAGVALEIQWGYAYNIPVYEINMINDIITNTPLIILPDNRILSIEDTRTRIYSKFI